MVLPSMIEKMARALLESQGDAHHAVYVLVKEADADKHGFHSHDLITCAKAIVRANEKLVEDALNGDAPAPAIALADDLDLDLSTEFDYGDVPAA
jgi:hypothetical protein